MRKLISIACLMIAPAFAAKAKLYDLANGKVAAVLEYKGPWWFEDHQPVHGAIKGLINGERFEGQFNNPVQVDETQTGTITGRTPNGFGLVCDYAVTMVGEGVRSDRRHGLGTCTDGTGKKYKLIF